MGDNDIYFSEFGVYCGTSKTYYSYDKTNTLKEIQKRDSNVIVEYDPSFNIKRISDNSGEVFEYNYNDNKTLEKIKDSSGNEINYEYDENNNLKKTTLKTRTNKTQTSEQKVSKNGNLLEEKDYRGNVTLYDYDDKNRVVVLNKSSGEVNHFKYDDKDKLVQTTYDIETDAINHKYTYDNKNRISKVIVDEKSIYNYSLYDEWGNLKQVILDNKELNSFTYLKTNGISTGLLQSKVYPNGTYYFNYDEKLRLKTVTISINNIAVLGSDLVVATSVAVCFAQTGVVIAIMLKAKNKKLKSLCIPSIISGILGVTEPAIYGITLPRKKPFILSCIGGAVTGGIMGLFGTRLYSSGAMGLFVIPTCINPVGIDSGFYGIILATVVGLVVGFALVFFFGKLDEEDLTDGEVVETVEKSIIKGEILTSPIKGVVKSLSDVKDEAFASGLLGKGIAIEPKEGKIIAPADGTLTTLFPTLHALGITTDSGAELLIHVGMDTVKLEGKHFKARVKQGDKIKKGNVLLEFDINAIKREGYSLETPVIITNFDKYLDVIETNKDIIEYGENLITVMS